MNTLLAGFGNVGRSLAQLLAEDDRDIRIVGVVTATRGALFHAGRAELPGANEYPTAHAIARISAS